MLRILRSLGLYYLLTTPASSLSARRDSYEEQVGAPRGLRSALMQPSYPTPWSALRWAMSA